MSLSSKLFSFHFGLKLLRGEAFRGCFNFLLSTSLSRWNAHCPTPQAAHSLSIEFCADNKEGCGATRPWGDIRPRRWGTDLPLLGKDGGKTKFVVRRRNSAFFLSLSLSLSLFLSQSPIFFLSQFLSLSISIFLSLHLHLYLHLHHHLHLQIYISLRQHSLPITPHSPSQSGPQDDWEVLALTTLGSNNQH